MDDEQHEARALASPTRHRIFRALVDASDPLDVRTLAGHVGCTPNAVRQHLAVLEETGLAQVDTEERHRRGRPRQLWSPTERTRRRWRDPGPYEQLATVLARAMADGDDPVEAGRRIGEHEAAALEGRPVVEAIETVSAAQGFRPSHHEHRGRVELVLERCPFASAAAVAPGVVCELHRGIAEGMAEVLGGVSVEGLVARPPERAGCRLLLRPEGPPPRRADLRRGETIT